MRNRIRDRSNPFKAQVAIARRDGQARHLGRPNTRSMDIELLVAEAIGVPRRSRYQFGTQNGRIESVRALPIADMNDAMVKFGRKGHVVDPLCTALLQEAGREAD